MALSGSVGVSGMAIDATARHGCPAEESSESQQQSSISRFSDDSLDFARRMLNEAHVAAAPRFDFDPIDGKHFLRFCYAGSANEMHEAVKRIGKWLKA